MNSIEDVQLAEKQAVMDTMFNYALAADTKNYDLMRSLMGDDATVHMLFDKDFLGGQKVSFDSVGNFIAFVKETTADYRASQHLLSNPLVHCDNDSATIRVNLMGTAFFKDPEIPSTVLWGFYETSMAKVDGHWKISELVFTSIASS